MSAAPADRARCAPSWCSARRRRRGAPCCGPPASSRWCSPRQVDEDALVLAAGDRARDVRWLTAHLAAAKASDVAATIARSGLPGSSAGDRRSSSSRRTPCSPSRTRCSARPRTAQAVRDRWARMSGGVGELVTSHVVVDVTSGRDGCSHGRHHDPVRPARPGGAGGVHRLRRAVGRCGLVHHRRSGWGVHRRASRVTTATWSGCRCRRCGPSSPPSGGAGRTSGHMTPEPAHPLRRMWAHAHVTGGLTSKGARDEEGADRQPGRDRDPGRPSLSGRRDRLGRGVRRPGPRRAACQGRRRGLRPRRCHRGRDLPRGRQAARRRGAAAAPTPCTRAMGSSPRTPTSRRP